MIVKDETAIIERCLTALRPHIDSWVILDTGSTDGTQRRIEELLDGVPGYCVQGHFENFGQARNDALATARDLAATWVDAPQFDYLLLADADMELAVTDPTWRENLTGHHALLQRSQHLTYRNTRIIPANSTARYVGVTHEYLDVPDGTTLLDGLHFIDHTDGSSRGDKYSRDIALLTEAHTDNPQDARTVFYLAQSHRDNGDLDQALRWYDRRIQMGGWAEEAWYARYQLGVLAVRLGAGPSVVADGFLAAHQARPARAEPLTALARYHRERGEHHLALIYASQAIRVPYPKQDRLFIDHSCYQWRALDEYALACHGTGHKPQAAAAWTRLLASASLPAQQRTRILGNLGHALQGATA